jgi:phage shock protein E
MIQFLKNLFGMGNTINLGELIANGAQVIDVRTPGEYQAGHLKNSVNIPLDRLKNSLSKLDKNKSVITCCASGMRSGAALNTLKANGFTAVYNGGSWASLRQFTQ